MNDLLNTPVDELSDESLMALLGYLGHQYRIGQPLVTDAVYDQVYLAAAKARVPGHEFFAKPEPEPLLAGGRYKHSVPMLSTEKAYSGDEVNAWVSRIKEACRAVSVRPEDLQVRVMPKLDGLAGYRYQTDVLVTRGRDGYGTDVSGLFSLGVVPSSSEIEVAGEIVIEQAFFKTSLKEQFGLKHSRNFIAGLANADTLSEAHRAALAAGVCRFVAYPDLPHALLSLRDLQERWQGLPVLCDEVPYLCDGLVVEIEGTREGLLVRGQMGATSHHHNWMLALKVNEGAKLTKVAGITLQTGRTGRIVPVLNVEPVEMDGVTISNVTAHTADHLLQAGLGIGAMVEIVRSGGVIPALVGVQQRSDRLVSLDSCPSCGSSTHWEGPHLYCSNQVSCPAQCSRRIEHWFSLVGVCDGFGPSVCDALTKAGISSALGVFQMGDSDWAATGISAGIVSNLRSQLARCLKEEIPDSVFLGAMGIPHLGRGDSRKILEHHSIEAVTSLTAAAIEKIDGFGKLTSTAIHAALQERRDELHALLGLGFNLTRSKTVTSGPLVGQVIVFTGTMVTAARDALESQARGLGAKVSGSVNGKTTLLVCGASVGAKKTDAAAALGVKVVTESEYLQMIA